jgi:5-formyltetrahydrofolate cyclo-ligase
VDIDEAKREVREEVWKRLDEAGVTPPPGAYGRIPDFVGADLAAERLAALPAWRKAKTVKANPDTAQMPVRVAAVTGGKVLYMAVPKIADIRPFYLLDPHELEASPADMASSDWADQNAEKVAIMDMQPVDIVVCGSVAVDRSGVRIGKGAGYSDIEVALLTEANLISSSTLMVTTVHQLQIVDGSLPESSHDFSVDLIVTPDEVIECGSPRRPRGIYWEAIREQKIQSIPVLAVHPKRPLP